MALPATDNFNRTDDPNGLGSNWTTITGCNNLQISSNEAKSTFASPYVCGEYWNADSFNDDQYSKATFTTLKSYMGVAVRISSSANSFYIFGYQDYIVCRMYKCISGTTTQIGSDYYPYLTSGDVVELQVEGTTLTPIINGTPQDTRSDSSLTSGSAGLWAYNGEIYATWDDWEGGNIGGGPSDTELVVANASHALTSDSPALTQVHTLAVANAAHALTSDNINLDVLLVVEDSSHALTSQVPTLISAQTLEVDDASHAFTSEEPNLGVTLAVENAVSAFDSETIDLLQQHLISVEDALHSLTSDNVDLEIPGLLVVQDASHSLTSETPTLAQQATLEVQDSGHALTSDNVNLKAYLTVDDAIHAFESDNVNLGTEAILDVQDAYHAIFSDRILIPGFQYLTSIEVYPRHFINVQVEAKHFIDVDIIPKHFINIKVEAK